MQRVEAWKTGDGKVFDNEYDAKVYEAQQELGALLKKASDANFIQSKDKVGLCETIIALEKRFKISEILVKWQVCKR